MIKQEKRRRRLRSLKINEVSFVDDPAVPSATFLISKRRARKVAETRAEEQTLPNERDTGFPLTTTEQSAEQVVKTAVEILLKVSAAMPPEMVEVVKKLAALLGMDVEAESAETENTEEVKDPKDVKALEEVRKSLESILGELVGDVKEVIEPVIEAIQKNFSVEKAKGEDEKHTILSFQDGVAKLQEVVNIFSQLGDPSTSESDDSSETVNASTEPEVKPEIKSTTDDVDDEGIAELLGLAEGIANPHDKPNKENSEDG